MAAARPDHLRFQTLAAQHATAAPARTLHEEWDALADRLGAPPFLRPGWIEAWCGAYAAGPITVLPIRRYGELAGVLPLLRRHRTHTGPTNSHTPLFGLLAADPAAAGELAERFVEEVGGALALKPIDPSDPATAAFEDALRGRGQLTLSETVARAPYVPIEGDFDNYLRGLSKNLRKQVARRRRRLEEAGHVSIEVQTSARGLSSALEDFVGLESSAWQQQSATAVASRGANRTFYSELAAWAASRGSLRLSFLALDGRPIAAEFALEENGVRYALKSGFDPGYRSFGPGQLLTHESLARSFEARLRSYEFLGSDDDYKLDWTSATRERIRLRSFPPTLRGRVGLVARRRVRPMWLRLRRA